MYWRNGIEIMTWVKWRTSIGEAHKPWKVKGRPQDQAPLFLPLGAWHRHETAIWSVLMFQATDIKQFTQASHSGNLFVSLNLPVLSLGQSNSHHAQSSSALNHTIETIEEENTGNLYFSTELIQYRQSLHNNASFTAFLLLFTSRWPSRSRGHLAAWWLWVLKQL